MANVQGLFYSSKSRHILTVSKASVVGQVPQGTHSETEIAMQEPSLGAAAPTGPGQRLAVTRVQQRPQPLGVRCPGEGAHPWAGSTHGQGQLLEDNQL